MSFADEVDQRLIAFRESLLKVGTVTGTDGTKVIVLVEGSTNTYPCLTSYTPTIGDVVLILTVKPGAWFVLGKPA